jgi:hypothetical protein
MAWACCRETMTKDQFEIGKTFWTATGEWRCTDIGTRTIVAIKLDYPEDPSWYNGPPYVVQEHVFDENDMTGCSLTEKERLTSGTENG